MEGRFRAAKRAFELMISQSWHTGAFSGAAFAGKLKKLDRYLKAQPEKAQAPAEMLATMRELQARGAKMTFVRKEGNC